MGRPVLGLFKALWFLLNLPLRIIRRIISWHPKKGRGRPKKKAGFNFKGKIKYVFLTAIFLSGSIALGWFYINVLRDLPDVNEIYNPPKLSTTILDRNGVVLYKFYDNENRSWVPISKVPTYLIQATIAIEDKDFYKHHGISLKGIANAIIFNFKKEEGDKLRGGSTITQQLVKNVFFSNEKSFNRKIKEAILALMVESKLSKEEILERYFNQVAYGGNVYGVEEASYRYFGKSVSEIDLNQAAFLAGLPAAPSSYNPFGNNPDLSQLRRKHVLEEMANAGFITKEKADEVIPQTVTIINDKTQIIAPHFVFFIKDYLENEFGFQNFDKRGLVIRTTLDTNVQSMAEKVVKEEVDKVAGMHITNGAAEILDVKSGEILAMVGSKDYNAKDIDGKYNVTTALRQPGSSIKPINYLLALQKGWTFSSTISDDPITYDIPGQKPYSPQNYTGKYLGTVTLKTALASSLNIPSVKLLAADGINNMIDLAETMGITTWKDRSRFGLSLALGGAEVKMTELAGAYTIFANLGDKVKVSPILEIKNYLGEKVYEKTTEKTKVIDPSEAFLMNDALSDNQARTPIFGPSSKLVIPGKTVAVKTGTTNNLKDNWCLGWTPSYLVAAWVGNNDATPMSWVASGVSGATPIWNRIITNLLANKSDEKWEVPMGVEKANVCGKDGFFLTGTESNVQCPPSPTPTPEGGISVTSN